MSALSSSSTGDTQVPATPDTQARSEHAPELVSLFQAQSATSSQGASQGNGARDMLKAGQRRLRQLAIRQKKPKDPQTKAEQTSLQLLALEQEGFLPVRRPPPKKTGPKSSIDSTLSSTRSASSLSFRSSSRRDVESIGQPWLVDPLERCDNLSSRAQLSSLDFRDLTSLVEAAMTSSHPHNGGGPSPDRLTVEQNWSRRSSGQGLVDQTRGTNSVSDSARVSRETDRIEALPAIPKTPDLAKPGSPTSSTGDTTNMEHQQNTQPADPEATPDTPADKTPTSNSPTPPPSAPGHTLKLFPDTLPPRVSSKGAWRLSPPPNRPLPTSPEPRQSQDSNITNRSSTSSSRILNPLRRSRQGSQGADQAPMARLTKPPRNAPASPVYDRFPEARSGRRRSSLPMGTLNAFPLPAPMRPLPSLPEPGLIPQADRTSNTQSHKRESDADTESSNRKPASAPSEDGTIILQDKNMPSQPSSPTMLNDKDSASGAKDKSHPATSGGPLARSEQSRADRVRALRLKDLSTSRMYLRGSEQAPHEHRQLELDQRLPQTNIDADSPGNMEDRANNDARYRRTITSGPLSPPPLSPILSRQSQRPVNGKEPNSGMPPTPLEEDIPLGAFPVPGGPVGAAARAAHRCETALPSSDEELIHSSPHQHQSQPIPSQHRRVKQTSVMGDPALHKARHTKKKPEYSRPLTPRDHHSYQHERVCPDSRSSQSSFYSQDPRGSPQLPEYVLALEKRIAQLTHQNKALQAALLAALDMNNKQGLDGLLGGSETSLGTSATAWSFSSATNTSSGYDEPPLPPPRHPKRGLARQQTYRPQSWIASPDSSRPSSCESANSANVRDVEDMLEGFDFSWRSDKPAI
ncbi:hypothetical protein P168DRAFT_283739 [Aspergillus campestris IBT 28561]|uniref:Uncharacterized protein n=1 Tax=Aspergillus campestris (strain IBT 28561) TaxID=1392248 RepID=A0A2I1CWG7_ASPC2|nr:uncharacterized protein P168DRAFT_283739 [Aspergillus campestris IBT 28561]PKY01968.1 hypothetical protein P168DRAFT_283739 [Aspergillus campestris IBT 28561]